MDNGVLQEAGTAGHLFIVVGGELLVHHIEFRNFPVSGWVVQVPGGDESPAVECRLVSYAPESCRLVGEIVNVSADESVLDEDGKIDPDKLRPITFDPIHHAYRVLGKKVGNAFQDGAKLK